ncbi:hypothetical protein GCM10012284_60320 [Mangrovihabitans endophyticus]|uniref:DUF4097 domain-containing protein n=2 Tax=Mangrovihabitans endophyticus TaxID=1751298 RepID=A0A8J3C4I2_9ACTN|nr:hypothetical protein GCM10012284_60320 [Mangrovihabitans endophyticus]
MTHARRAGTLTVVLAAAAAATLAGCDGGIGATLTYDDTEKTKVTEIVLTGGSGDVMIKTAAVDGTHIKRVVRNGEEPPPTYRLNGSVLTVDTACGGLCSVSYEIEAPTGVAVHGRLSSGEISLTGVGDTDVTVTSGNIRIRDATAPVRLAAHSGDIEVRGSTAATQVETTSGDVLASGVHAFRARSTSGDVQIDLAVPASVTAQANSGNVDLSVPTGRYAVRTSTGSGDAEVGSVTNDPTSPHVLTLSTSSGDVYVSQR